MTILTLKTIHLIAMVAWFCGLFYMFRLFVYHVENLNHPSAVAMLETMERKLYKFITLPAMIVTLLAGNGMLFFNPDYLTQRWLQLKVCLIFCLVGYTVFVGITLKRFKKGNIFLSSKQCRMINEIPTLFLMAIIALAVFRIS